MEQYLSFYLRLFNNLVLILLASAILVFCILSNYAKIYRVVKKLLNVTHLQKIAVFLPEKITNRLQTIKKPIASIGRSQASGKISPNSPGAQSSIITTSYFRAFHLLPFHTKYISPDMPKFDLSALSDASSSPAQPIKLSIAIQESLAHTKNSSDTLLALSKTNASSSSKKSSKSFRKSLSVYFNQNSLLSKTQSPSHIFKNKLSLKSKLKKLLKHEISESSSEEQLYTPNEDDDEDIVKIPNLLDLYVECQLQYHHCPAGLGSADEAHCNKSFYSDTNQLEVDTGTNTDNYNSSTLLSCKDLEFNSPVNNNNQYPPRIINKKKNSISVGWLHPETEYHNCNSNSSDGSDSDKNSEENCPPILLSESDVGISVFMNRNKSFDHYYYNDDPSSSNDSSLESNAKNLYSHNCYYNESQALSKSCESQKSTSLFHSKKRSPSTSSLTPVFPRPSIYKFYNRQRKSPVNDIQQLLIYNLYSKYYGNKL